jgi:hypothetical protein
VPSRAQANLRNAISHELLRVLGYDPPEAPG